MNGGRTCFWLLAALGLSVGAHFFLAFRGNETAPAKRATLSDASVDALERITVARAGETAAELRRGDVWRLTEPFAASADEKTVIQLVDAITVTPVSSFLSQHEQIKLGRTLADFGLDPARVTVTFGEGEGAKTFRFGNLTPGRDGVYVMINNEDTAYIVSSNICRYVDLPPEGFRRRSVFPPLAGTVQSIDLKRGAGSFLRMTRERDTWMMTRPSESPANDEKVKELLLALFSASAAEFIWPTGAAGEADTAGPSLLATYGLDPESAATLTLKCSDGIDRQVVFGKEATDGRVYALVQNAGAIVTLDAKLKELSAADAAAFTDNRLFPVEPESVTRISISENETDYLLAKQEDGSWRLDAPVTAAADPTAVELLLTRLLALKGDALAADGIAVTIATNSQPVKIAKGAALGEQRLEALRSREIMKLDPMMVKRVTVTPAEKEPVAVVYDRDRRGWNVESAAVEGTVDEAAVKELLRAFNPLTAAEIVKLKVGTTDLRDYGLETPRLVIALDQFKEDSVRRNLLIGAAPATGGVYATLGGAESVFLLPNQIFEKLNPTLIKEQK